MLLKLIAIRECLHKSNDCIDFFICQFQVTELIGIDIFCYFRGCPFIIGIPRVIKIYDFF
ncbi:hypothetical protein BMETH_2332_0 [methanotrophic bacterial endosymbiont of Bathymodiolus sp.]|nr:hypothetical protein BMETH_2332_0 [methanotrophic bacterial endosymbiont of Bathymodiolus sp.]